MPPTDAPPPTPPEKGFNAYPWWALRFWSGMRIKPMWGMMRRGRFRVDPYRWGMALILAQMAPWNSALYRLQQLLYGRQIRDTVIDKPPVFIIGHWRSGTTHLHELLSKDPQFDFCTTYECFAPHHFLVSEWLLTRLLSGLLPSKRPMDNMATGFERPQEDEFGLVAMGAPTTYYRMAFPREPTPHMDTLNMRDVSDADRRRFLEDVSYFYKALTVKAQKQLLMKSPPHTGRVRVLSKLFPGAKFVHITRHPYAVFPSMKRCWQSLYEAQGFQRRTDYGAEFEEFVHRCYEEMYADFEEQTADLPPGHLCEVRYDDLARDPIDTVRGIYDAVGLGDFDAMRPALEEYIATLKDYQPNKLRISPEQRKAVDRRWSWYMERYSYPAEPN